MMITEKVEVSDMILASGGFADVRTGTYMGHLVAVKTMRVGVQDSLSKLRKVSINNIFSSTLDTVPTILLQQFCKEALLWNMFSHPNVLKLVGVLGDMGKGVLITVSEWMAHGNIMEFIKKNHVNRLELARGFTFPVTSFTEIAK